MDFVNIRASQWPEFDTVYSTCGENMFLFNKALNYWVVESSTQPVDWNQFQHVSGKSVPFGELMIFIV